MPCMHRILHVGELYIYNKPLMIIIALVLELVEKPMATWTLLNMLLMLTNVTSNPMEKWIRQQVQNQKLVSKFCNLLQRTNQTSNVKGVSRTHEGKSLIMTIAWSGKRKRSHTMWAFEFYTVFIEKGVMAVLCCYELSSPRKVSTDDLDYSHASYMKQSWLGHAWYV